MVIEEINLKKISDTCEVRTHAGYPTGLAGQRLNHSAKVSATAFYLPKALIKSKTCAIVRTVKRRKEQFKIFSENQ